MPVLVFEGGLTIAARICSAVRRVPTPFNDGPMSPPSRPMRWHERQLLSVIRLFTSSPFDAFGMVEPLGVEAGGAGREMAMPKGVRRKRPPGFASSIIHS